MLLAGVFINNGLLHGLLHPEAGHIMVKVILWGGIMHKPGLIEKIRSYVEKMINGYMDCANICYDDYIVLPVLGEDPGIIGATQLALDAILKY